jgi:DNA-directed RNA polymerase subunit RPC12/RpoP
MLVIQSAVSSLKTAGDIAKGFLQLKSIADVQGKVIELQSAILGAQTSALAAQSEQATMIQRVRDLEEEVRNVKAWEEAKQRYSLYEPTAGSFVYALKENSGSPEPSHWICTNCYENNKRSILQLKSIGKVDQYVCPHCYSEVLAKGTAKDTGHGITLTRS